MLEFWSKYKIHFLVAFIVAFRFFHFGNEIDRPHAWRQYDTKQYIDSFYYDDVPFHKPSVCWMGGHETLILEFPLPEYLIAKMYHVFGNDLWIARLFILIFFTIGLYYLYAALKLLYKNNIPEITVFLYGFAPLSLFFSRAIHIDFFVLAFSFGMMFHLMKAIKESSNLHLLLSLAFSCIAFLVKAPYAFFLAIPILVYAFHLKKLKWLLLRSALFVIPIILLFLWNSHSKAVNSQIPNWDMIPNFNKFDNMWYWYFGTIDQRLQLSNWTNILSRIKDEILGISGLILLGYGLLFHKKNFTYLWALSFLFGALVYLVIFFNLNNIHNYYQIPFIAPLALLLAMSISTLVEKYAFKMLWLIIPIIIILEHIAYSEANYYSKNEDFTKIARIIRENSDEDDLIIVSVGGLTPQCPLILNEAQRKGWSIPTQDLSPKLAYYLYKNGDADKIAILYGGYFEGEFRYFFESMENKKGIPIDEKGTVLYICDLKFDK